MVFSGWREDRMTDKRLDLLESFRRFICSAEEDAPVPPVSQEQLKRLHKLHSYLAKWHPGSDGAVSIDLMVSVCDSEADLPAVWFRHTQLSLLIRQGVLAKWQHSADLDDVVYQVAATIPMSGLRLDHEAFLQRLRFEATA